jgi:hypothetical protein
MLTCVYHLRLHVGQAELAHQSHIAGLLTMVQGEASHYRWDH